MDGLAYGKLVAVSNQQACSTKGDPMEWITTAELAIS